MTNDIPYIDFGGNGRVLHFAHANAYSPECFRQFLRPLTETYHVWGITQRPLWPGQQPENLPDWRLLADDLIRFFDQMGWQQVIGVGHSLGAAVTMAAAVKRPDLFHKLVLIEPVFLAPTILQMAAQVSVADVPFVQKARNRRYLWPDQQTAFAHFRKKSIFARWADDALWDYVKTFHIDDEGQLTLAYTREWEAHIYGLIAQQGGAVWDLLPEVAQPMLGIRAADTDTIFPEAWELWRECQPEATLVEMPDVSHMLIMERPLAVADMVLQWLHRSDLEN